MHLPGWAHAAIWLVFGALVLLPPVWLAVDALGAGSAQGVELLTGDQWRLFGRSLSMAAGAASLALVLGVPYALLCERTDLPGRSLWMLAGLLPLLIPAFVHALTWARVLAPNRPVATWLQAQLGGWAPSIHSPAGAALVLALAHLPFVILLAQAGLRSVDRTLEEAAALRLAPRMVWWRVTLPLILPYLLAGGLFVLVFALADFAVADTLRLRVYPVEVFIELSALFDEAAALRLSLPLLAVMLLLVGLIGWLLRGRAFVSLGGGRAGHELLALGRRRWAALAFCALVIGAAVLLPLGVLLLDAGAPTNYWQALQVSAETILTGIALAVAAALSTTALALGVALSLRALGGGPARVGLDLLSQLPFALAPILLGIGLIKVWNHPATLWLYGSAGMLIVGYLARLAPFAVRILDAALAQVAESQLEAARLAMGGWRLLWWVVLPLLRRGLAATLLLCFVLALGELGLALLITPPGLIPIPIEIYNYLHYGAEERVAALCLILIAAQLGPIALLYPLWQRSAAPTLAQRAER